MQKCLSAVLCLCLAGCATRQTAPGSYRLDNKVLIPPGVPDGNLVSRTFVFPLGKRGCGATSDAVRIEPREHSLRVTVFRYALLAHPAPWLAKFTALPCLTHDEAKRLAEAIVESVPLNATAAFRLLHAGSAVLGYADLAGGYRLKVVTPILRAGAPEGAPAITSVETTGTGKSLNMTLKRSPDFLGYEISWYTVDNGRIRFATAESHIGPEVTSSGHPLAQHFLFPESSKVYRLFYLTRVSQADHNVAVLSAADPAEMARLTPDVCEKAPAGTCEVLAKEVAVTAYLQIQANGKPVDVAAESNVGDALRAAGVAKPRDVLATLTVSRAYHGKLTPVEFDRAEPDILAVPLAGGEEIRW